ncbi:MAG: NAD(P)-dependent alcohol dehydrogenase [Actinobacteria bacterium]|nr:NAD(P)-dependent alcohol dehydrogenase [Actinomycetota bacterium]MDA2981714.1 NAD(P)-dependent alcohol dehydrogenase [Actinomycetota bacterium]MDA2996612.1 NAD(P)-dependent alcohol dehydrogenase [Actinomycetota bacterium]
MQSKGYAVLEASKQLVPFSFSRRDLRPSDVALSVSYAGICHSDIHQAREEWGPALFPMVPGHEIAGVVTAVGSNVTKFKVGDQIGVGVFVDSCRECSSCSAGLEQYCLNGMTGTYNNYERDGKTLAQGGYADSFVIDQDYAVAIPKNLDMAGVAPLLCAGITLYSPLKNWGAGPGKKVGVIGLGGLGHMGLKFAAALGARTTVFSHSPSKEQDARKMGANDFVVTSNPKDLSKLDRDFDLILNTVSADMDLTPYLQLLKLNGTLVLIGLPINPYVISTSALLAQRRSISGSMIGGITETQEMLNFCGEHNIVSEVEVIDPDYINQAYERTVASDVKYRFVIDAKKF